MDGGGVQLMDGWAVLLMGRRDSVDIALLPALTGAAGDFDPAGGLELGQRLGDAGAREPRGFGERLPARPAPAALAFEVGDVALEGEQDEPLCRRDA